MKKLMLVLALLLGAGMVSNVFAEEDTSDEEETVEVTEELWGGETE